ncbi:MAG TPA: HIT family protein [Streptosporangiaceae bacterium]|nr:HIT family protein [Streptosporangiaceae bacterium]
MMGGMSSLNLVPGTVVDEGPLWTVAVNRNQGLIGKTMVILNRPCEAVVDIGPAEWSALHAELQRLVPALTDLFVPDQFNFAFLMNLDAQVHLHVIPRYATARQWRGLRFEDDHWGSAFGHEQRLLPPELLQHLAAEIRDRLSARI